MDNARTDFRALRFSFLALLLLGEFCTLAVLDIVRSVKPLALAMRFVDSKATYNVLYWGGRARDGSMLLRAGRIESESMELRRPLIERGRVSRRPTSDAY